ncbi:MAG: hypothetical protein H7Y41_03980 [Hyphomonadaceae bacterium]|nr:hypothetical protein [Clostridia bacterium]
MATIKVNPGICGLLSTFTIQADDEQMVSIKIRSDCPHVLAMQAELVDLDGYAECFSNILDSTIYKVANDYIRHIACPVPAAIIKGMEVACGLALPKDVEIGISND